MLALAPLTLANVIALPLLFAPGVSTAWQHGEGPLLAASTTRAVVHGAPTNGTAFGALAVPGHPGTASMGLLLMLDLVFVPTAVMPTPLPPFAAGAQQP